MPSTLCSASHHHRPPSACVLPMPSTIHSSPVALPHCHPLCTSTWHRAVGYHGLPNTTLLCPDLLVVVCPCSSALSCHPHRVPPITDIVRLCPLLFVVFCQSLVFSRAMLCRPHRVPPIVVFPFPLPFSCVLPVIVYPCSSAVSSASTLVLCRMPLFRQSPSVPTPMLCRSCRASLILVVALLHCCSSSSLLQLLPFSTPRFSNYHHIIFAICFVFSIFFVRSLLGF